MKHGRTCIYFEQDGATAHMANYCYVLNDVFKDRLLSCRLWPARLKTLHVVKLFLHIG
jgi:hypothetical protein